MGNWNSYEYSSRTRRAGRDYKCDVCGETILKGDLYESTYSGIGHEHVDVCPVRPDRPAPRVSVMPDHMASLVWPEPDEKAIREKEEG